MYTGNYNESEDNENEQYESNGSKNYLKIIVIVILAIILLGLLVVVFKGKIGGGSSKKEDKYTLTISPDEIVVPLGKTKTVSYEVRNNGIMVPNANVRLVVTDESIASVDNTIVTGLKYGDTTLTATYVASDGKSYQETKNLTVADGNPDTPITNVTFPEGDLQMPLNGTYTINLGIAPSNGFVKNKTFTSSNHQVVIVDNSGVVTALSEGEATINIDVNNGAFKKDIKVYVSSNTEISKVVISPTGISINGAVSKLKVGETANLTYSILPANASVDGITWVSSDDSILTVDYRGTVTAVKEGSATITVSTFNNVSDSVSIEVEKTDIPVSEIKLSIDDLSMIVGENQMLVPVVSPDDATDKTLTYNVDDPSIVSLTPSADTTSVTITALAAGTVTLTITDVSGTITKTVTITVEGATPTAPPSGGSSCASCNKVTCGAGKYCSCGKCYGCPAGNYCYNNKKTACPAGKGSVPNSSSYQDCSSCAKGLYATGDGKGCVACPSGYTTSSTGSTKKADCNVKLASNCAENQYKNTSSSTGCSNCPSNFPNSAAGSGSINDCYKTVAAGKKMVNGIISSCAAGTYSTSRKVYYSSKNSQCTACSKGKYQDKEGQSSCASCPANSTTSGTGSTSSSSCICKDGYYKSGSECKKCYAPYYCRNGSIYSCPNGGKTSKSGATSKDDCVYG